MTTPAPPSIEEARDYFLGLPSQPRLVARTDSVISPWTRPLHRVLCPVTDTTLVDRWKASSKSIRDAICRFLSAYGINWSVFLPLVVVGRPFEDDRWNPPVYSHPMPNPQKGTFLLVGVHPRTCTWAAGFTGATACRTILSQQLGVQDMHVLVVEFSLCPLTNQPSPTSPSSRASHSPQVPPSPTSYSPEAAANLQSIFNPLYGELTDTGGIYKHTLFHTMHDINNSIVPFLPFPGQIIQAAMPHDEKERPRGTVCCYMRLENADGSQHGGVFALTSRHVVLGDLYDYDLDFITPLSGSAANESGQCEPETGTCAGSAGAIPVSWGSSMRIYDMHAELKHAVRNIRLAPIQRKFYNDELSSADETQLCVAKSCIESYVPSILKEMEREYSDVEEGGQGAAGRTIGHVAFAARHGHNNQNGWRDWALVAVDRREDSSLGKTGPPPTHTFSPRPPCPSFTTNHVYIGNTLNDIRTRVDMAERGAQACDRLLDQIDVAGFLKLRPPQYPVPGYDNEVKYVFKRGGNTGVTMGCISPIEAVVRTPLPGRDVVSWALPVLSLPPRVRTARDRPISFSTGGDYGSCIFDENGTIIGMVDAGVGTDDKQRRLYIRRWDGSSILPAPLPKDNSILPPRAISDNLSTLLPWVRYVDKDNGGSWEQIDITLATPFNWLLEDITDITGLTTRVV